MSEGKIDANTKAQGGLESQENLESELENIMRGVNVIRALVRPFLAISFTLMALWLTYADKLPAEVVGTAATSIAAFYFGERAGLKKPK